MAVATEELAGWPALEWAELVERFGADRARLRQDFEQRWLGVQFPGARLRELEIDVPDEPRPARSGRRGSGIFSSARLAVADRPVSRRRAPTRCASRRRSSARSRGAASRPNRSARRR